MTDYTVPQNYINRARDAQSGDAVRLPFPVLVLPWKNGNASYAEDKSTLYFGGWYTGADSMAEMVAQGLSIPKGFVLHTLTNQDGDQYDAYLNRVILASIIGKRKRWHEGRSHVQWLVYLADFVDKSYVPWGAGMLTAKGLSAARIEKALDNWRSITAQARREHASNYPEFLFWAPLGTFGKEPVIEMVGQGQNKSPITPCQLIAPPNIDKAFLDRTFIGQETIDICAGLLEDAREWLKAWDDQGNDRNDRTETVHQPVTEQPDYPPAQETTDDGFPF